VAHQLLPVVRVTLSNDPMGIPLGDRIRIEKQSHGGRVMMVPTMLDNKGTKILAKSLFKELRGNGYSANQILGLTTELIDLVTQDLRDANEAAAARRGESKDEALAIA
jgi:hypothetical protein